MKGSIQEEDITIVNIYAPDIGAPQYVRQTLTDIKGEIDSSTIIVGDFNTARTSLIIKTKLTPNKKMAIGTYISIITLNINGLNAPTKRHKLAEWIQKQDPYICCLQETHFRSQDTYRLKVRGWKNIFHENEKKKKAGVAILISDKIDLKIKNFTRDK